MLMELTKVATATTQMVVPRSICFTPDKNRTWAQSLGLTAMDGHTKGMKVAESVVQAYFDAGGRDAILWALSESNNGKRSESERINIKNLLKDVMRSRQDKREEDRTAFYLCGDWHSFRDSELDDLAARAQEDNHNYQEKRLTVLFGYRGLTDWKRAAAKVVEEMGAEAIENEDMIRRFMWIKHLPPHIDMFVRTGVDQRNKHNSDSLLPLHGEHAFVWDVPQWWPEFTVADLYDAFRAYGTCVRLRGG